MPPLCANADFADIGRVPVRLAVQDLVELARHRRQRAQRVSVTPVSKRAA